jgi:hypothetical protein
VVRRPEVVVEMQQLAAVAGLRSVPEALRRRPADRGTGIHMAVAGMADKVHTPEMGDKAGTVDMVVKTHLPPKILPIHWDNATSRQPARILSSIYISAAGPLVSQSESPYFVHQHRVRDAARYRRHQRTRAMM